MIIVKKGRGKKKERKRELEFKYKNILIVFLKRRIQGFCCCFAMIILYKI